MKRIGYIGILTSYVIFIILMVFAFSMQPSYDRRIFAVVLILNIILLLGSIKLAEKKGKIKSKLDKCLKFLCQIPLFILFSPLFLVLGIIVIIWAIRERASKKVKPLIAKGFVLRKYKKYKKTIYNFKKGNIIIEISPYKSYRISFDGGITFEDVLETDLGLEEERKYLIKLVKKFDSCDYREKEDCEDPLKAIVMFLTKNLN